MGTQIITTPGGERLVVIPEAEFLAIQEAAEDRQDEQAVASFRERLARGEEELVPASVVNRILDGENKVRVWREHRGISAGELAKRAGMSAAYLSQIETGAREGRLEAMKKIAAALGVAIDDLA